MKNKGFGRHFFVLILVAAIAAVVYVTAEPTGPNDIVVENSSRMDSQAAFELEAEAGEVTELTIDALSITSYWQGYYGNISGNIVLANANNDALYNWSVATPTGQIYASRNGTIEWTGVACMDQADIDAEDAELGSTGKTDSVSNTFASQTHPAFNVGATAIPLDTCRSTSVQGDGSGSVFYQVLLKEATSETIYTALIDAEQVGFDGGTYDFQMLVGEDGGTAGTTTYYFYVELN
jgi:hypothetical protein